MSEKLNVGIESIGFYAPNFLFNLGEQGMHVGQYSMAIIGEGEDIITMAYEAVRVCLGGMPTLNEKIDLLLFATESAIDNSKSAACQLYSLLIHEENHQCRCLEVKHACYGGTGALMMAKNHVLANPGKKALVVMSDIAYYGIDTPGEKTQGCGAIAMLISSSPKIAVFNNDNVFITNDKNDFYRPIYQTQPIYSSNSTESYIKMLKKAYNIYKEKNNNFDFFISHMPFARMLDTCCKNLNIDSEKNENKYIKYIQRFIGNTYTASLYIGLFSLLFSKPSCKDLYGKKILMFSYGSGAECEMFSINILEGYDKHIRRLPEEQYKLIELTFLHNSLYFYNLKHYLENEDYDKYKQLLESFEKREKDLDWVLSETERESETNYIKLFKKEKGVRYYEIKIKENEYLILENGKEYRVQHLDEKITK